MPNCFGITKKHLPFCIQINTAAIYVLDTKITTHNKGFLMPWTWPIPDMSLPQPLAVQATAVTVSCTSGRRQLPGTAVAHHTSSSRVFTVCAQLHILCHTFYEYYWFHLLK